MMSEPGSFAHLTLTQRWPAVVRRIIAENSFSAEITADLESLVQELGEGQIRYIQDAAFDAADWQRYLEPLIGIPWLDVPWFFAEVYFYRRILEATRYFQPGEWQGVDPFWQQKQSSLESAMPDVRSLSTRHLTVPPSGSLLLELLYGGLWGNGADLSLRPEATAAGVQSDVRASTGQSRILVDDSRLLLACLTQQANAGIPTRIDLIADNAGFELVCDLLLVDGLLTQPMTQKICLHLKAHPTFVSDATIADVDYTLKVLAADSACRPFAERLNGYLDSGRLQLDANAFWTAPLAFWQMPIPMQTELAQADLAIVKGDANYRRLLGDCHWSFTTSFADIVCYFPTALVALRTLKSEIVAGLESDQIKVVSQQDPTWLTNGRWGLIQVSV
jgi:hypothetical protein